jgi:hypothetical protein
MIEQFQGKFDTGTKYQFDLKIKIQKMKKLFVVLKLLLEMVECKTKMF